MSENGVSRQTTCGECDGSSGCDGFEVQVGDMGWSMDACGTVKQENEENEAGKSGNPMLCFANRIDLGTAVRMVACTMVTDVDECLKRHFLVGLAGQPIKMEQHRNPAVSCNLSTGDGKSGLGLRFFYCGF